MYWYLCRPQRTLDLAEAETYKTDKAASLNTGTGIMKGKGRGHWSSPLIHNSFGKPFPFDLDLLQVEMVAFSWDEYCDKCGATDSKVSDYKACTYQGKPAVQESPAEASTTTPPAGTRDASATPQTSGRI